MLRSKHTLRRQLLLVAKDKLQPLRICAYVLQEFEVCREWLLWCIRVLELASVRASGQAPLGTECIFAFDGIRRERALPYGELALASFFEGLRATFVRLCSIRGRSDPIDVSIEKR